MKSFKEYITEGAKFKYEQRYEYIAAALKHADTRSRKTYIERLNKMSHQELQDVENAADAEALKWINANSDKNGEWDEKKELDVALNAMDAAISSIIY